jgi:hypothetical protein
MARYGEVADFYASGWPRYPAAQPDPGPLADAAAYPAYLVGRCVHRAEATDPIG